MKLILTADVDHLGGVGDTVEVKDGYGRNFLLPRGLAIVASRGAQKQADDIHRARETKSVRDLGHANELKTAIESLGSVSLPVRTAADSGKLFGSVTSADVVARSRRRAGRTWTSASSGCPRRTSRPSARTRCRYTCTPRSMSSSRWTSSPTANSTSFAPLRRPPLDGGRRILLTLCTRPEPALRGARAAELANYFSGTSGWGA